MRQRKTTAASTRTLGRAAVRPQQAIAKVERLPTATSPENLLGALVKAAADPACQPEKLTALIDARDRLMAQEARVQFVSAYIDMQEELPVINAKGRIEIPAKRADRKAQATAYATYQEINRVTKPILKKHRFALITLPDIGPDGTGVVMRAQLAFVCDTQYGRMVHSEHCAIQAPLETSGSKNNVQGVGSSLSYTKRYCYVSLLNLVSEAPEDKDDNGKTAGGPRPRPGPAGGATIEAVIVEAEPIITQAQADQLRDMIESCGVTKERFCERFQIDAVADLPARFFDDAMAACRAYQERTR